jgi:hypothetical protein
VSCESAKLEREKRVIVVNTKKQLNENASLENVNIESDSRGSISNPLSLTKITLVLFLFISRSPQRSRPPFMVLEAFFPTSDLLLVSTRHLAH